jgi:hypothetical protein
MKEFKLKLEAILKEFLEQGSIEVYGDLKIAVTSFNRQSRIAFQKINTIYVSIKARGYPEGADTVTSVNLTPFMYASDATKAFATSMRSSSKLSSRMS